MPLIPILLITSFWELLDGRSASPGGSRLPGPCASPSSQGALGAFNGSAKAECYRLIENLARPQARRGRLSEKQRLLFASMVEAALWHYTGDAQKNRLKYGLLKFRQWYLGDGTYGDGPPFHWDYYNGYVIHPMLMDILKVCREKKDRLGAMYDQELLRAQRYAAVQERLISPEATFPVLGRSSAYRFAAFQALAQIILWRGYLQPSNRAQLAVG